MGRIIVLLIAIFISSTKMYGQIYEREKPLFVMTQHRVHVYGVYEKGKDGIYKFIDYGSDKPISPDNFLKLSDGNERFYAFDKKNNRLYFYTDNLFGYYSPTEQWPMNDVRKGIKNAKVTNVTLEDIGRIIDDGRKALDNIYIQKNDSILEQKRITLENERKKQIKDSLENANKRNIEYENYRRNHDWHELSLSYSEFLNCKFCGSLHTEKDLYVMSLSSDTIYYIRKEPDIVKLGQVFQKIHYAEISESLKKDKKFREYVEIWKDSIALYNQVSNLNALELNVYRYLEFKESIRKIAPYGYIESWGWNLNYADGVEPYFHFYNTSEKTIKYVDFYFSLYNDVGDRCLLKYNKSYTGSVRGVGPVETDCTGEWSWSRATHYTSADATEMRITKIVITYMDKTTRTLTVNAILYE